MNQQYSTHRWESAVKTYFWEGLMFLLAIHKWGPVMKKSMLITTMFLLILSIMPLTAVSPSLAEIYRWKDEQGVVRYSNAAPKGDESKVLDVIPTRRVPLVEDADGKVYYLNLPDSELTQDMSFQDVLDQLTLPADVLDELMEEASAKAQEAEAEPLSTVTFRLTELEEALEREITKRLEWEQEYLKSQARGKHLEQRNEQLQLALVDMGSKIDKVQKAVALSEIHASALREPQQQLGRLERRIDELQASLKGQYPEQELGQLEGRIAELQAALAEQNPERELSQLERKTVQLQAYLTEISQQGAEDAAELSSTLDNVQEEQGLQLASLSDRLDELEIGVGKVQQQSFSEKFAALSQDMQDLKSSLPEGYDDSQLQARLRELQATQNQQIGDLAIKLRELETIKVSYEQSMQTLSEKLGSLELSMESLEHSKLMAKVDALMERVAAFEQQPQDETIHVKLAALETAMATLTDAVPASRENSTLMAELLESKKYVETMTGAQAEQLQWQRMQITMLRDELEQVKARKSAPQKAEQAAPAVDPAILAAIAQKNTQMENVIQQQAGTLTLQQERIVAIESKLERALAKSDSPVLIDEQPQEAKSNSSTRITVVGRQYRRGAIRPSTLGLYVTK